MESACVFSYSFQFYSFDNDNMKLSKRHAVLLSLIFLLKGIFFQSIINFVVISYQYGYKE